ncbi:hypothetical protein MIMGU_mgv1a008407mg [Erythranthe guttata]|uniref:Uncharacterized protein n=1 Tax=Erythranthe guttata TaxID=4155 RepID=A0A022Q0U3_ERYGU|nr:hypothetical protein MIMGU_mgv1a008407mg [Erythranthe guttata]
MKEENGADSDGIDRISNLPNEILCHILSLMPVKYAVGTSILSTKWKNLFPLIPNLRLRLDDSLLLHPETPPIVYLVSFIKFVDRLLNITLLDAPSLQWISSALRLKIRRMDIRIRRLRFPKFIFDSLYGCNITSLNILFDFADNALVCRFNLPNLHMLSVQCMKFVHLNILVASCPVLEYLVLNSCICQPGRVLRISVPSLKALKVISAVHAFQSEFEIDAPNLEYINYEGFLVKSYKVTRMRSLRIARFELDETFVQYPFDAGEKAFELARSFAGAEKYWMSKQFITVRAFFFLRFFLSLKKRWNIVLMLIISLFVQLLQNCPQPLPIFTKMIYVSIKCMDFNGWGLLARLLGCAPLLEKLLFRSVMLRNYCA